MQCLCACWDRVIARTGNLLLSHTVQPHRRADGAARRADNITATTLLNHWRSRRKSHLACAAGIKEAYGKLVCFTDDDAIWNSYFLKYLLAPFNDDKMGGTGSNQIMRPTRMDVPPTSFERIGDMRLSSRMLEAAASTFYDGSVSCLSGRTALYHKRILQPLDWFEREFCNEYWLKCALVRSRCCFVASACNFRCQWEGASTQMAAKEAFECVCFA